MALLDFADIFELFVTQFGLLWDTLRSPAFDVLGLSRLQPWQIPPSLKGVYNLLVENGLSDVSLLGFILAFAGTLFGTFLTVTLVKWWLDVIF